MTFVDSNIPQPSVAGLGASAGFYIRKPHPSEIQAMVSLFEAEVRAGRMLPRSPHEVHQQLENWLVATNGHHIIGCVSLVFFNQELCEVRSLAVDPAFRGHGLGSLLVSEAVELARQRGMRRVLSLTRAARLFEQLGFQREQVSNFPEKVWRDCAPCPFRECCDEVALVYSHVSETSAEQGADKKPN